MQTMRFFLCGMPRSTSQRISEPSHASSPHRLGRLTTPRCLQRPGSVFTGDGTGGYRRVPDDLLRDPRRARPKKMMLQPSTTAVSGKTTCKGLTCVRPVDHHQASFGSAATLLAV